MAPLILNEIIDALNEEPLVSLPKCLDTLVAVQLSSNYLELETTSLVYC